MALTDAALRPPLDPAALNARLVRPGGLWREIRVIEETGSTNAVLLGEARAGAAEGLVLVAESQTAGRGRLGRSWSSPPRAALTCSVLLRPAGVPPPARAWLPLLTGIAVAAALRAEAGVAAGLKWPNDVLVGDRKIAGILAEAHGDAVVAGVGLNVTLTRAELPVPTATSLLLENAACLDRGRLLAAVLTELASRYTAWAAGPHAAAPGAGAPPPQSPVPASPVPASPVPASPAPASPAPASPVPASLRAEYLRWCVTIGREVRVELPGGALLTGTATDVDEAGRLAVRTGPGSTLVGAGDVVHVR
jgi:BirA family biotin operon repressor/biotin-[acetyl-CoA-carboxylase] ligase